MMQILLIIGQFLTISVTENELLPRSIHCLLCSFVLYFVEFLLYLYANCLIVFLALLFCFTLYFLDSSTGFKPFRMINFNNVID